VEQLQNCSRPPQRLERYGEVECVAADVSEGARESIALEERPEQPLADRRKRGILAQLGRVEGREGLRDVQAGIRREAPRDRFGEGDRVLAVAGAYELHDMLATR